ncbi:MAG: AgmX/PglI C-terminal domain-containing protein [Bdellovibrionales bacterium]|nr:AgmX/PglI C-terminal domain-containing protein [Bdellovibrionales bacterium]
MRTFNHRLFSSVLGVLTLVACASKGPLFKSSEDQPKEQPFREAVRATVREHEIVMRDCYNVARRTEPKTEGKLQIEWTIGSAGQVEKAVLDKTKTTLKNEALIACVLNGSKTWTFPKPEKDSVVVISYPIVFTELKDGSNVNLEAGSAE